MVDAHGAQDAERNPIGEILGELAARGYDTDLVLLPGARVGVLGDDDRTWPASGVTIDEIHRLEGDTNPDDEEEILALSVREADLRGTVTVPVGAAVPPEVADALRAMAANHHG